MSTDRFILLTTGGIVKDEMNRIHYKEIVINPNHVVSFQPCKEQIMVGELGYKTVHGTTINLIDGKTVWVQEGFNAVVDLVCGPDGEIEMLNDDDPPTFGGRMNGNDPQN